MPSPSLRQAISCALLSIVFNAGMAQQADELPGASYASIARLPDFSGWWGHMTVPSVAMTAAPPPFNPDALRVARAANPDDDPLRYCRPWQFTGSSGGFTEAVEFLFTPGRVTLTNERGMIRRVYTGGQPIPPDLDATNMGLSLGRWDGGTLIIETTLLNPSARFASVPIGENARVTERIFLKDADTLQFDIVTVAPDMLTAPYAVTQLYTRLPKSIANEISFCTDYDRSIEPGSGKQRFDMTPPPDLPPPPRR